MKKPERLSYVTKYRLGKDGVWTVRVKVGRKREAVSDGRSISDVRRRIRQAIALLLDAPEDSFDLLESRHGKGQTPALDAILSDHLNKFRAKRAKR